MPILSGIWRRRRNPSPNQQPQQMPRPTGDADSPCLPSGSSVHSGISSRNSSGPATLSPRIERGPKNVFCGHSPTGSSEFIEPEKVPGKPRAMVVEASSLASIPGEGHLPTLLPAIRVEPAITNVGRYELLNSLSDEFRYNAQFAEKVRRLSELGYVGWRRVRGDGNCFYRAVGFGLVEQLVGARQSLRQHWSATLHAQMKTLRFDTAVESAAHADLLAHLKRLADGGTWDESPIAADGPTDTLGVLWRDFRDSNKSLDLALVRGIRELAAVFLRNNADDAGAAEGITFSIVCTSQGFKDIDDYCAKVVTPLGVEVEGIGLNAVSKALQVGLRIAFLDRKDNEPSFCEYVVPREGAAGNGVKRPIIHMQLRPGHYDLLYARQTTDDALAPEQPGARNNSSEPAAQNSSSRMSTLLHQDTVDGPPTLGPPSFGFEDAHKWQMADPPPEEFDNLIARASHATLATLRPFNDEREALEQEAFGPNGTLANRTIAKESVVGPCNHLAKPLAASVGNNHGNRASGANQPSDKCYSPTWATL